MAAPRTYVRVAPDSTGKKVLGLQARVVNSDGSEDDVVMQNVVLVDESGRVVDIDQSDFQSAILARLDELVELLRMLNDPGGKHLLDPTDARDETDFDRDDEDV